MATTPTPSTLLGASLAYASCSKWSSRADLIASASVLPSSSCCSALACAPPALCPKAYAAVPTTRCVVARAAPRQGSCIPTVQPSFARSRFTVRCTLLALLDLRVGRPAGVFGDLCDLFHLVCERPLSSRLCTGRRVCLWLRPHTERAFPLLIFEIRETEPRPTYRPPTSHTHQHRAPELRGVRSHTRPSNPQGAFGSGSSPLPLHQPAHLVLPETMPRKKR